MKAEFRRSAPALVLIGCALAAASPRPAGGQSKKPPKKAAASAALAPAASAASALAPPKIQVIVDSVFDRRTTSDFPGPELAITFKLEGEDAGAVLSARANVARAVDDTGKNLADASGKRAMQGEGWQQSRENDPPTPRIILGSPTRKARTLTSVEGVLEVYLPGRDPAATVKIDRVMARKDKPLASAALASQRVRIQVLSKAGLEKEKARAEAAKKAEAARKKKKSPKKSDTLGMEVLAEGMADALVSVFERLFSNVGENDLILKVDDPGKKIFSFDLAGPDGAPIQTYGTTDLEGYRIVRVFEPIPESATLQVRLKTARSFGEVPFSLSNVKLP
ncbi:MAG: hypothetical protein M3S32_11580 [Acidobacteriota bacterium]|nr:hypothetical protein [Acidobacteriota bacterium]